MFLKESLKDGCCRKGEEGGFWRGERKGVRKLPLAKTGSFTGFAESTDVFSRCSAGALGSSGSVLAAFGAGRR